MKTWVKVVIITLIFAIPTLILGPIIWPHSGDLQPTSSQSPYFIFLAIMESITFGLGICFIIFGWPLVNKISNNKNQVILSFISISWLLISWWPHDNLHAHIGLDLQRLLYIEYGFHLTLIIASLIVAYNYLSFIKKTK